MIVFKSNSFDIINTYYIIQYSFVTVKNKKLIFFNSELKVVYKWFYYVDKRKDLKYNRVSKIIYFTKEDKEENE